MASDWKGLSKKEGGIVYWNHYKDILEQLHCNHMGIKKTKLLAHQSIYWIGKKRDVENHIKLL